ncbi:MAG: type III-B CRISPR module RAMP protein Cmr1 [Fimbriimonadales bacterium]|nr:MAG: type III-B CRISPR module RAMP protein Cmr1 [Fimbriimonadales bacterium]
MRKVNIPAPEWQEPAKGETLTLELRLITPMFGGGYATGQIDPLLPIRSAAIRGHLRFWWRATAGARYASVDELYMAETDLWGGASTSERSAAGKVAIRVEILDSGQPVPYSDIAPKANPKVGPQHGYFLFPFQPQQGKPAATGRKDVSFRLTLTLHPDLSDAQRSGVRTALKAWIAFGGVGARTRRGCGALTVVGQNASQWLPPTQNLAQWLPVPRGAASPPRWATLADARGMIVIKRDAEHAWCELGRFWARFRKGHFPQNYSPMSGSKWADYRQVLCRLSEQQGKVRLAKPFLGLPIIYQDIKGARNLCFVGSVEPAESGRMASPVILKPIALQDGRYGALILVMNAPKPRQIQIQGSSYTLEPPQADPVLKALQTNDVLDAVLKGAQRHFQNALVSFQLG